jgi:FtsZ-binding cell division protein ZapB
MTLQNILKDILDVEVVPNNAINTEKTMQNNCILDVQIAINNINTIIESNKKLTNEVTECKNTIEKLIVEKNNIIKERDAIQEKLNNKIGNVKRLAVTLGYTIKPHEETKDSISASQSIPQNSPQQINVVVLE